MQNGRMKKIASYALRWETMLLVVLALMCLVFNMQD